MLDFIISFAIGSADWLLKTVGLIAVLLTVNAGQFYFEMKKQGKL